MLCERAFRIPWIKWHRYMRNGETFLLYASQKLSEPIRSSLLDNFGRKVPFIVLGNISNLMLQISGFFFKCLCVRLSYFWCCTHKACSSQPVWPDLAKFHHFGQYLKIFGSIFKVYFILGKVFSSLWYNFYAFGQICIVENGKILQTQSGRLVTLIQLKNGHLSQIQHFIEW